MDRTKQILDELKTLDLSLYPYERAKALTQELIGFYGILHVIPKGTSVLRARPNEVPLSFKEPKDLSYKPQEKNKYYQRASTPYQTAFYAGALAKNEGVLDNQAIVTLEASPLVRSRLTNENTLDTDEILTEKITYGKWEVIRDLPLMALCHSSKYIEKHSLTENLYESYKNSLDSLTKEQQQNSNAINSFFASEFAKDKIENDYDYLLSAVFAEAIINIGHAGVLYPSVRCEGEGFNVAIAPQFVSKHLRLAAVGETKIYYKNKNFFINNESFTLIKPGQKRFTLNSLRGSLFYRYTEEKDIITYLNSK